MTTVFAAFAATADAAPDHAFVAAPPAPGRAYHPDGVEITYGRARAEVERMRTVYAAAGYGYGHRVALLLENRPEFFFHYLALNALGCGIVPINPDYRHDEMLYQMEHSDADLAVVVAGRVADLHAVARDRASPLPVVNAEDWPASLPMPRVAPRGGAPGLGTECSLLYTSGTTGRPKGCILTNLYYLNSGGWYRDMGGLVVIEYGRDRILNPLPLYHMNSQGLTATCAMLTANCLILPERFSPTRWWQDVAATRATIVHYLGVVPPMIHTRAFGRPFGGLEASVVDDRDREVPRGTEGELLVRWGGPEGPRHGFFSGYLKDERATEEAWRGGWFHTGDVVRQDADGILYFVDSKKNIIRRSGENIAAAEIEAVIQAHDEVAQVAVLAVPDDVREEEVMACVVPMPGVVAGAALADRIFEGCMERLAYFKAPGWILFVTSLPTTGTQKVQKTQIFSKGEDPRRRPGVLDLRERKRR